MNKEELVKEVAKKAKVSQKAAADVLSATIDTVQKTVAAAFCETFAFFATSFTNSSLFIRTSSCITKFIILIFQDLAIVLRKILLKNCMYFEF